jgi:hypothetical protein
LHARADQLPVWKDYLQTVVPIEQKELSDLSALSQPAGEEATVNAILNKEQVAIEDSQAAIQAAVQDNLAGFEAAVTMFQADDAVAKAAARDYGLSVCAE